MRIEVWSDVVCPWCYIGKRWLERALAAFPHADQVEVVYRSSELDPDAPKDAVEPVADVLGRKYGGGPERIRAATAQVTEVAAGEGLEYHLDRTPEIGADVGLDPARVARVLDSEEFLDEVRADVAQARAFGAGGVPFFVVDRKYGVSGAQPVEVLAAALQRAWDEARPTLTVLAADGQVCGPEGGDSD